MVIISGISVGGQGFTKKAFAGNILPYVDHISHTHSIKDAAFSRGQPTWGLHLAEELERVVALHDAANVAAVVRMNIYFIVFISFKIKTSNSIIFWKLCLSSSFFCY